MPTASPWTPTKEYLYIAETSTIRIMRFPVRADGTLGEGEQFGPHLGENSYPDGCSFDQSGNLWVTMPFRNAIGVHDTGGRLGSRAG